jgi:hypothetical protein
LIVAIQQPEHLPWMGFFNKMAQVDLYVYLDSVQFKKRYFENRNRILTADGVRWLTVPVRTRGSFTQRIDEVLIGAESWRRRYVESLRRAYARAPSGEAVVSAVEEVVCQPWERLVDLNLALIDCLRRGDGLRVRSGRSFLPRRRAVPIEGNRVAVPRLRAPRVSAGSFRGLRVPSLRGRFPVVRGGSTAIG